VSKFSFVALQHTIESPVIKYYIIYFIVFVNSQILDHWEHGRHCSWAARATSFMYYFNDYTTKPFITLP